MKYILIALVLAGCTTSAQEVVPKAIPADLKDCKFYELYNNGALWKIVRCPNSNTSVTYPVGKSTGSTATVETCKL